MTRRLTILAVALAGAALAVGVLCFLVHQHPQGDPAGGKIRAAKEAEERSGERPTRHQGDRAAERSTDQPSPSSGKISGRVLLEGEDRPVVNARVSIVFLSASKPVDYSTTTAAQGTFELNGLPDGLYKIGVTHKELVAAHDPLEVEVKGGGAISGQVFRLKRGIEVGGRIDRAGTGEPLPEVEVVFRLPSQPPRQDIYPGGKRAGSTSEDGSFSIKGLAAGAHQVELSAQGYLRKTVPEVVVAASGQTFTFSLEPGCAVSGQVFDAAGRPAAGARVFIDPRAFSDLERAQLFETETKTDNGGKWRLEGLVSLDGLTLIARAENHAPGWVTDVRIGPNRESSGVEFHLQRGRSIRGKVLNEQGRPQPGAEVECAIESCGIDTFTTEARVLSEIEIHKTASSEQGEFEFLHLGGRCHVLAAASGSLLAARAQVRNPSGEDGSEEEVDLYLRTPKSLRGRVVDRAGNPLAGVRIEVRAAGEEVETDENGAFEIQGLHGGRVSITASLTGYQDEALSVRVPGEDASIVLHRFAVIAGLVRVSNQAAGLPPVTVRVFGDQGLEWKAIVPGGKEWNEGEFEVSVPPGGYVVQAEAFNFAPTPSRPIRVIAGERREGIVLDLLPGAAIKGTVAARGVGKPVPGAAVLFRPVRNFNYSREAMTEDDGTFELDSLPGGEFRLELSPGPESPYSSSLFGPFTVQEGGGKEFALELGTGGGIRGVFRERGEPPGSRFKELYAEVSREGRELYRLRVGPDGRFGCHGLPPGEYGVAVWGTRADSGSFHIEKRAVRVSESQDIQVSFDEPSRLRVTGRVASGGQPLVGATIAAMDPWRDIEWGLGWWDLTLSSATTDRNGRYELDLKGGSRYFLLVREAFGRGQTQVELALPQTENGFDFNISLPAGRLQGVVVEPGTAIPIADAQVEIFDSVQDRRSYLSLVRARRGRCKTDRKGRFAVSHLTPGRYSVRASLDSLGESWTHGISVGEAEAAEARIELEPGIEVPLRLLDPDSYPVTGVGEILRDTAGNLVTMPQSDRGLLAPPGTYEVTVVHPRYAPMRIPIHVNGQFTLPALTLSRGGTLRITVSDSAARPVSQAEAAVIDGDGRNVFDDQIPAPNPIVANPFAAPLTGDDGVLVLEHLATGKYRVSARKRSARSDEVEVTISETDPATARLILEASGK